jgi:site-specific recombinase XerD
MSQAAIPNVGDLADLIPSFLRSLRAQNKSDRTVATYREAAVQFLDFLVETGRPTAVAEIRRDDVEAFIEKLLATKSAATSNNRYRGLSSLFKFLISFGEIDHSPMERMSPPKLVEVEVPVITEARLKKLVKACSGTLPEDRRDAAVIRLFIDTGMRLSELANLKVDDIDLDNRTATVMGKGRRPRQCSFGTKAAGALDRYIATVRARSPRARTTDALWLGNRGPLGAPGIRFIVERRAEQAGIGHLHAHQFRHSFAHGWQVDEGNETDLMRLMGWKSREMLNRYAASAGAERAAASYQRRISPGDRL